MRFLVAALVFVFFFASILYAAPPAPGDRLSLSGSINNLQGKGVKEVEVEVLLNGRHLKLLGKEETITTGSQGNFQAVFLLPENSFPGARIEVKAAKPSWQDIAPSTVSPVPSRNRPTRQPAPPSPGGTYLYSQFSWFG